MINVLISLSHYLFNNFGLSIIVLTIIVRLIILPLTLKQLRATKAMQLLQPKLLELQRKYAKDKNKLAQEQMKLYRESGVSAAGCAIPMIVQFPIWIALYQAVMLTLAVSPEGLLNLSRYLYPWPFLYPLLPLENSFLGLDLASGNIIMAILVGATMWVQQKMVTTNVADPRQAAQTRMMLWMMPLLFAFFSISFPAGLSLYWIISNIISIVIQYYVTGWGGLSDMFGRRVTKPVKPKGIVLRKGGSHEGADISVDVADTSPAMEEKPEEKETEEKHPDYGVDYPPSRAHRRAKKHRPPKE